MRGKSSGDVVARGRNERHRPALLLVSKPSRTNFALGRTSSFLIPLLGNRIRTCILVRDGRINFIASLDLGGRPLQTYPVYFSNSIYLLCYDTGGLALRVTTE